jgi:hypothetical protein
MNAKHIWSFLAGALLLVGSLNAHAANVDVSLDLFPTNPGNPGGGGTFAIYAKTDEPLGIAAINMYISNVSQTGLTMESDIAGIMNGSIPYSTPVTGGLNILYGQNPAGGPVLFGVGTALTSDGPDPLGNPAWNGATKIYSGIYGGALPAFITSGNNSTGANVFAKTGTPPLPAGAVVAAMSVNTVVRAAPEPAALTLVATSMLGMLLLRRK